MSAGGTITTALPRQRVEEPTGQYAVVVDAAQVPYVRIGHRWYRAGNPTVTATPWPAVRAVAVISGGQS